MYQIIISLNYYYLKINFSVALRKNEQTIVSGISDIGGHNPVFQSYGGYFLLCNDLLISFLLQWFVWACILQREGRALHLNVGHIP